MVTRLIDPILGLHGLPVYLIVAALVFAEAAILAGFVIPGETAVILGGVIASRGGVSLDVLVPVVVVAAIAGDTVGYAVGRRFGTSLLGLRVLRHRKAGIDRGLDLLRRRGPLAVFLGRFTAFLRAMVPGLSGMSGMHYPTFLIANAAGGIVWGVGYTLLGYAAGDAYHRVERVAGWVSDVLLALILVGAVVLVVRSRRREHREEAAVEARLCGTFDDAPTGGTDPSGTDPGSTGPDGTTRDGLSRARGDPPAPGPDPPDDP